jgi:hypothetical protein
MTDITPDIPIRDMEYLLSLLSRIIEVLKEIRDRLPEKTTGS